NFNTAMGRNTLGVNISGTQNTAVGHSALNANTASGNTAVGFGALFANTTGVANTAMGAGALDANVGGGNNTAVGQGALTNASANSNTAVGAAALSSNVSGDSNTAVGDNALFDSTGSGNIAIGASAGVNLTTGGQNIYIGNAGMATESNTMRIGGGGQLATFIAGISGVAVANSAAVLIDQTTGQLGTLVSTQRAKEDIDDMGEVSAGLLQLRPVVFRYKKAAANGSKPLQYGLIAEEVAEVMPELVVYNADGQPQTVQYHVLPALLLNELQRQQAQVHRQEGELAALRELLAAQAAELAELKAALRATTERAAR
ncbi:MAG: tail fiber domain-containing protein, partial [Candidatus Acidiferrales bacterium]